MELRHVGSKLGHDSRYLVAQNGRRRDDIVSGEEQVGVAQPGCLHVDENFPSDWRGDVHGLECRTHDRVR
jgi:hypothetical protein